MLSDMRIEFIDIEIFAIYEVFIIIIISGGQIRDPKIQKIGGSNPACVRSTRKMYEFFRVKNVVLTRSRCAQPPCVYTHV